MLEEWVMEREETVSQALDLGLEWVGVMGNDGRLAKEQAKRWGQSAQRDSGRVPKAQQPQRTKRRLACLKCALRETDDEEAH